MKNFPSLVIFLVLSIFFACSEETSDNDADMGVTDIPSFAAHAIEVRTISGEAKFFNRETNSVFTPRGVNYFYIISTSKGLRDCFFQPGTFDATRVRNDFALLRAEGFNTVRIFLDSCSDVPGGLAGNGLTGLNPAYIENIAKTMAIAAEENIYLLLTSNDVPDGSDYWSEIDAAVGPQFAPYRNSQMLSSAGVGASRRYWDDLLRALAEENATFESVLAWSLYNEQWYFNNEPPFSLNNGMVTTANGETYDMANASDKGRMAVDGMVFYIDQMREIIDRYDPNALVTMGFFEPDYPNPLRPGDFRYVETAPLLNEANLDFFDFHSYPGAERLEPINENFGAIGFSAKPVIMGEVGAFIDRYSDVERAVEAVQGWIAESCQHGYDGWLYWGLYRAPVAIGDATWGFLDPGNDMLEHLSASSAPDLCDESLLPPTNLALNKSARASQSLPDDPPANAVDGNRETIWSAGAHPTHWIEIDLGTPQSVRRIDLVTSQFPAGVTTHQIQVRGNTGTFQTVNTFNDNTEDSQTLTYEPSMPIDNVRYIRIQTTQSPSWVAWREIEVY